MVIVPGHTTEMYCVVPVRYELNLYMLWSEFLASEPDAQVRFSALPDFLRSSGSGTGSTQLREYN
jgi:hypothetical protein